MEVLHLTTCSLLCFAIITSINGSVQYLYDMRPDQYSVFIGFSKKIPVAVDGWALNRLQIQGLHYALSRLFHNAKLSIKSHYETPFIDDALAFLLHMKKIDWVSFVCPEVRSRPLLDTHVESVACKEGA